ncbi:MAG TPA: polysaccharide deacetylase family protein [Chitinophaga sp.]
MRSLLLLILGGCMFTNAAAQADTSWHHKKCAVVLTYDDALDVDLDHAIPVLDSLGLKATFYLSAYSGALDARINEWRAIAKNGHELGNHTLFHPCAGDLPGRNFVTPDYDLSRYTFRRITDEINMTNTLLKAIDGKTTRTFAYPCGDEKIKDSLYLSPIKDRFAGARGTQPLKPAIRDIDLYNIGCYAVNGQSGAEMIAEVKQAMADHRLLVFLFHGVGGGHSLNVSSQAHRELLHFLKQHEKEIWIAPMVAVAEYVKQYRTSTVQKRTN